MFSLNLESICLANYCGTVLLHCQLLLLLEWREILLHFLEPCYCRMDVYYSDALSEI